MALDIADITPSPDELATLMRARTDDGRGNEGAWSDSTRPTLSEVVATIAQARILVLSKLGTNIHADYYENVQSAILFKAAQLIEAGYYPEQANEDQSVYRLYSAQYLELMDTLAELVQSNEPTTKRIRWFSLPVQSVAYRHWPYDEDLWTSA